MLASNQGVLAGIQYFLTFTRTGVGHQTDGLAMVDRDLCEQALPLTRIDVLSCHNKLLDQAFRSHRLPGKLLRRFPSFVPIHTLITSCSTGWSRRVSSRSMSCRT